MRTWTRTALTLTLAVAALAFSAADAQAYIGPGVGLTAIGTLVAFVGAIFFALVGFIWYPIKRMLALFRNKNAERQS